MMTDWQTKEKERGREKNIKSYTDPIEQTYPPSVIYAINQYKNIQITAFEFATSLNKELSRYSPDAGSEKKLTIKNWLVKIQELFDPEKLIKANPAKETIFDKRLLLLGLGISNLRSPPYSN